MDNAEIAGRLEAFATLLELADANPYTIRAYRRAAETIRGAASAVSELVGSGRVRELRGIGPGIEARLRSLGVHTAEELRAAAADGRLRAVPGIGPVTEARLLDALARENEPRPHRALLLHRARELVDAVATALGGAPPATCAGGATRASGWPSSAAPRTPLPCSPGSRRCPRSWP